MSLCLAHSLWGKARNRKTVFKILVSLSSFLLGGLAVQAAAFNVWVCWWEVQIKAVVPLQPQQSGFVLLAKKSKSKGLPEQATSLFLHSALQIIGNLQTINILYQFFQTLPVISSGALSVTTVLSFPKWWNQKSCLHRYSFLAYLPHL